MKVQSNRNSLSQFFFIFTLAILVLFISAAVSLLLFHSENDLYPFAEPVATLTEWTLTDSTGFSRAVTLPETIPYGKDGVYTLSRTLPEGYRMIASPAFCFYSNYVDVSIAVDGRVLYTFPKNEAAFSGATGNTYHFVRMPLGYGGKTVTVTIRGQLGKNITYLLNPPRIGAKATMLRHDVMQSLPLLTLAVCMCILAIGLCAFYFVFRKRLGLNNATMYTVLFALLFGIYIFCETMFAQLLIPNGYMLCFVTLTLLALVPIPLIGIFMDAVSARLEKFMYGFMALCAVNLIVQAILNFNGIMSVRASLPATHIVIIISIVGASFCMLFSDRAEKPAALRALFSAVPMILGGTVDIILINLNMPSLNNCLWFALGVTAFILIQLCGFIGNYFKLYRTSFEAKLLANMAYHDDLSGIGNRNAYERRLKELCAEPPSGRLCCIVTDLNDLKFINDRLGHQEGDIAIAAVGSVIREYMPENAAYFRTGGDEFVILLDDGDEAYVRELAMRLETEAERRGASCSVPISLAVGFGQYAESDENVIDFIRRVDTIMYECKRRQKSGRADGMPQWAGGA